MKKKKIHGIDYFETFFFSPPKIVLEKKRKENL